MKLLLLFLPFVAAAPLSMQDEMYCAAFPYVRTATACENQNLQVTCLPGNVISVIDAYYGRQRLGVCSTRSDLTTNCKATDSLQIIRERCEGRTSCLLTPNNQVFGDPCIGTPKYLKMVYKCLPPEKYQPRLALACEHKKDIKVTCPDDEKMLVTKAFYGRDEEYSCPGNVFDTRCFAHKSFEIIRSKCHNKPSCVLSASNSIFGDPCKYTNKLLKMEYYCVKRTEDLQPIYRTICEHRPAETVSCPSGKVLLLEEAFYGRDDASICPAGSHTNILCKAGDSERLLRSRCDSRQSCTLLASNSVFGDPCVGTTKYIKLKYYCVTRKI